MVAFAFPQSSKKLEQLTFDPNGAKIYQVGVSKGQALENSQKQVLVRLEL